MRTGANAIAWAHDHAHTGGWYRLCLKYVRLSFGLPGGTPNAGAAWDRARFKHRTNDGDTIPAAVPVFWETSGVADHIALSLGNGICRSTDAVSHGNADKVRIDDLTRKWGMTLKGWTEDLNGYRVYQPKTAGGLLDFSSVLVAARDHHAVANGTILKRAVANEVGKGAMNLTSAVLGAGFRTQYSEVQRKYLHAVGAPVHHGDDNGIPGLASLKWLAGRHHLSVK